MSTPTNAAGEVLIVSMQEQMTILDALPAEVKAIVHAAPVPVDVREFKAVVDMYGDARAAELIKEVLAKVYPGWTMPTMTEPNKRLRLRVR
jgi:hypothetical protein